MMTLMTGLGTVTKMERSGSLLTTRWYVFFFQMVLQNCGKVIENRLISWIKTYRVKRPDCIPELGILRLSANVHFSETNLLYCLH